MKTFEDSPFLGCVDQIKKNLQQGCSKHDNISFIFISVFLSINGVGVNNRKGWCPRTGGGQSVVNE